MSIFFFFNIVTNLYNSRKKTEIEVGVYKTKFYVANTREWQRPYIRVRYATTIEHERFCQIDQSHETSNCLDSMVHDRK
jgi:hypothetical protein